MTERNTPIRAGNDTHESNVIPRGPVSQSPAAQLQDGKPPMANYQHRRYSDILPRTRGQFDLMFRRRMAKLAYEFDIDFYSALDLARDCCGREWRCRPRTRS